MIAILSKSKFEKTTEDVIDWLIFFKQKFKRINGDDYIPLRENNSCFNVAWYWRWQDLNKLKSGDNSINTFDQRMKMIKNNESEKKIISEFFFNSLDNCFWLSNPLKSSINKLIVLKEAQKFGLKIPETKLINQKEDLISFKKNRRIITKSFSNPLPILNEKKQTFFFTKEITDEDLKKVDQFFPISFCQELIEKKFEVRVFFLVDTFYSMAIFNDEVDGRNNQKESRRIPFKLPSIIENKLLILLKNLEYNFASIDLLFDDIDFYFLELNPVGQFGMLSSECNYNLEKKIAIVLKNENEKTQK